MAAKHRFLKLILPTRAYEAVKDRTKLWLIECKCGHKRDLWDLGGVRYKAIGKPLRLLKCPKCGKTTWQKIRKKTDMEKNRIES